DDVAVVPRDRHQRPLRVLREPPIELDGAQGQVAPGLVQQVQVVAPLRRLVRRQLVAHYLVDVPSAALNTRRACVPVTVSFTEIRSQAPASTSSNVRGGYGSMLLRRRRRGAGGGGVGPGTAGGEAAEAPPRPQVGGTGLECAP